MAGNSEVETLKLRIRPATRADIPAMVALARSSATAPQWSAAQYEQMIALPKQEECLGVAGGTPTPRWRHEAGARHFTRVAMVIEERSVLQGFAVAREIDHEWELENIAVASSARRRGLGAQLLGEFLEFARRQGAKSVYLEVRESNRAARSLYVKCAFIESGHRKSYYSDPEEDAILYRLDFA
ncbi:MAG TPA: ribosomal protein S18-alanine N-acetyltransferase [Terriglobales bacterium]|nr:ribosomal protein S18-alanine N-acetyltransferase [Terriglobales bacterium]